MQGLVQRLFLALLGAFMEMARIRSEERGRACGGSGGRTRAARMLLVAGLCVQAIAPWAPGLVAAALDGARVHARAAHPVSLLGLKRAPCAFGAHWCGGALCGPRDGV